ncbi:MAG: sugar ABC transporter permease [bacterium]|nr:sugar ABC transporter permease [Candidatus Sumerlaeota bacterium]
MRLIRQGIDNEYLTGMAFILPWLAGFLIFVAYPIGCSVYLSLCVYDGMRPPEFIGLANYASIFRDRQFYKSLWNTLYIIFLGVPLSLVFSLALAMLLNQKRRGISAYRTLIYMPCLTPVVAMSVLWLWIFNPEHGLLNLFIMRFNDLLQSAGLGLLRLPVPGWMNDPLWAKPALIIMGLWCVGGTMLIFLASLQDVPRTLFEAADIDGANWWQKQRHVTLPMLSPVIFYNAVMGFIGGFQYFTQVYVMTDGSGNPNDSTLFYALSLFNNAFPHWRMGYASAQAWILFFITLGMTLVVFRISARRVYYHGA